MANFSDGALAFCCLSAALVCPFRAAQQLYATVRCVSGPGDGASGFYLPGMALYGFSTAEDFNPSTDGL